MTLIKAQTKAQQRETQKTALQRKRIKHGVGKWQPKQGISKQRKKMIEKKITITRKAKSS